MCPVIGKQVQSQRRAGTGTGSRTAPPGRVRQYAKRSSPLARLDTTTAATPEGALSGHNESDWHVASGDEEQFAGSGKVKPGRRSDFGDGHDQDDHEALERRPFGSPYRISDFSVPATDDKGHDRHARVTFSPELLNEVVAVVRSGKFPIESVDHFIRVAVFELLRVLEHIEPIENSHLAILETMNRINENVNVVLAYERRAAVAIDSISMLVGRGLTNQARIALHDQLENAKKIKVREVRDRIVSELRSKFKGVLKGTPVKTKVVRRRAGDE